MTYSLSKYGYVTPKFRVPLLDLDIELGDTAIRVRSHLSFERIQECVADLELDGEGIALFSALLDSRRIEPGRLRLHDHGLTLSDAPDRGTLTLETEIIPGSSSMHGLIRLGTALATHCEPEGFRRIAYFPDRPDIWSSFRCRLIGDRNRYPKLLANGRMTDHGSLSGNRHFVVWHDTRPKPSYLFALAAGHFETMSNTFTTKSGRLVRLNVYAEEHDLPYCHHGLDVLGRAMAWEEREYRMPYELDSFNVVVIRDYPGGAMENPGLNLHGTEFFLADPDIATDEQIRGVTSSVAHEFFHEWSGNRVGLRAWRELGLKEGLTVLRQQQFMADQVGSGEARIDDVVGLRKRQFLEDDGALAHAIHPQSVKAPNNLYTRTVYDKGAEVLRMLETLLGKDTFRDAIRAFFIEFDGAAASIEDLILKIEKETSADLSQFRRWYEAVGAFCVSAEYNYEPKLGSCTITLKQSVQSSANAQDFGPMEAPVIIGFVGPDGEQLPFCIANDPSTPIYSRVLVIRDECNEVQFSGLKVAPTPSLFRNFSAPVRLNIDLNSEAIVRLALFDSDPVNRWDAAQTLARRAILERVTCSGSDAQTTWVSFFGKCLATGLTNAGETSRALTLPSDHELGQGYVPVPVEAIAEARKALAQKIVAAFGDELLKLYHSLETRCTHPTDFAARRLRNLGLALFAESHSELAPELGWRQFVTASNMTDASAGLRTLVDLGGDHRLRGLTQAFDRWQANAAKLDHWCTAQASSRASDCPDLVRDLIKNPVFQFNNTTRVRAVFDTFLVNQSALHRSDGAGYDIVANTIAALVYENPRLAVRILKAFSGWRSFDDARRGLMKEVIRNILRLPRLPHEVTCLAEELSANEPAIRSLPD